MQHRFIIAIFCLSTLSIYAQEQNNLPIAAPVNVEIVEQHGASQDDQLQETTKTEPTRKLLDRIIARVNGINILLSDLSLPRINHTTVHFTLDDMIDSILLSQEAKRRDVLATASEVAKRIAGLKSAAGLGGLSDEQFEKEHLLPEGFTLKQYKREISRLVSEGQLLGMVRQERVFVTRDDVAAYDDAQPLWRPASYALAIAVGDKDLLERVDRGKANTSWTDLGWFEEKDLDVLYKGVVHLAPGKTLAPMPYGKNHQIIKLVAKKEPQRVPLDERYTRIEEQLQREKMKQCEQDLKKELREKAHIVYVAPPQSV